MSLSTHKALLLPRHKKVYKMVEMIKANSITVAVICLLYIGGGGGDDDRGKHFYPNLLKFSSHTLKSDRVQCL